MSTEREIQELLLNPTIQRLTSRIHLLALANPNSLEYKAMMTIIAAVLQKDVNIVHRLALTQLLVNATEKRLHLINQHTTTSSASSSRTHYEESKQYDQKLIQALKQQLLESQQQYQKLQQTYNEIIKREENILENRANLQNDKIKLLQENQPDADNQNPNNQTLEKRLEALEILPTLQQAKNLDIIKEFQSLGITGAALLRLNKLRKQDLMLQTEHQEVQAHMKATEAQMNAIDTQYQQTAQELRNLEVAAEYQPAESKIPLSTVMKVFLNSIDKQPTQNPSLSNNNSNTSSAGFPLERDHTWRINGYAKVLVKKEEDKEALKQQNSFRLTPKGITIN